MTDRHYPISRPIPEALKVLAAAIVIGLVTWMLRPDRLPLYADPEFYTLDLPAPVVSVNTAREGFDGGLWLFVDTRPTASEGYNDNIPGAFVIRAASFDTDLEAVLDFVFPEDTLVLYGDDSPVPVGDVAARFLARGYQDVHILRGGLPAWRRAGGPIESEVADE